MSLGQEPGSLDYQYPDMYYPAMPPCYTTLGTPLHPAPHRMVMVWSEAASKSVVGLNKRASFSLKRPGDQYTKVYRV